MPSSLGSFRSSSTRRGSGGTEAVAERAATEQEIQRLLTVPRDLDVDWRAPAPAAAAG